MKIHGIALACGLAAIAAGTGAALWTRDRGPTLSPPAGIEPAGCGETRRSPSLPASAHPGDPPPRRGATEAAAPASLHVPGAKALDRAALAGDVRPRYTRKQGWIGVGGGAGGSYGGRFS